MKVEEARQITNKALEELVEALENGQSEALTAYLKTMSLFSKYSLNNLFLIARQRPDACRVAGFHTWQKLGRYVRKGEKAIAIIAPLVRRKSYEETEEAQSERLIAGFRVAHIFSEEQTDGGPLPELGSVTGNPSGYFDRLTAFVAAQGIALEYSDMRKKRYSVTAPPKVMYLLLPHLGLSNEDRTRIVMQEMAEGREVWSEMETTINGTAAKVYACKKWGAVLLGERILCLDRYPLQNLSEIEFDSSESPDEPAVDHKPIVE